MTATSLLESAAGVGSAFTPGMTLDGDTHITDTAAMNGTAGARFRSEADYYHGRPMSAEDLVREMNAAGVDAAVCWQNPAATVYSGDPDSDAEALMAANRYVAASAKRFAGRIIPAGWTDPRACGVANARTIVEVCVRELGFVFVKLNAAQNRYRLDSPEVVSVLDTIVGLGATPAFHFGADTPYTPATALENLAMRYADHPLLAVHMGGGGAGYVECDNLCREACELGLRRPNIKFVLSALRDTHIENNLIRYQLAGEPFRHNLICASDAPYGRMSWNFGGFRRMFDALINSTEHPDERVRRNAGLFSENSARDYLGGNLARLLAETTMRVQQRVGPTAACI